MRTLLYNLIKEAIMAKGDIKHFALWNRQVEFIQSEQPFKTPAVFLEISRINWSYPSKPTVKGTTLQQTGEGTITVHLVAKADMGDTELLDLADSITARLKDLHDSNDTELVSRFYHTSSETNHNHEELVEELDTFSFKSIVEY